MTQRIGILGGSFNPVHIAHLILAQDAREAFHLDRVLLLPCATPPHKNPRGVIEAYHRVAMLKLAAAGNPVLEVSTLEIDRGGISYSVETLEHLASLYPGAEFFFIVGADTLTELHTWRRIGDLLKLCTVVSMRRPGYPWRLEPEDLKLPPPWPERLLARQFEGHEIGISASDIRRRIAAGADIRYLVPDPVAAYMAEQKLYRTPEV